MKTLHPRDVPEALTTLYLRLNGFFTSGLVLHSPKRGKVRSDIDCLAVWHPFHDQSEREVDPDSFLELGGTPELLLCEVKSSVHSLSFNKPLQTDPATIDAFLRWSGLIKPDRVKKAVDAFMPHIQDGASEAMVRAGVSFDGVRIRALLCCPGCSADAINDRWCISGVQMMDYANRCLNPKIPRQRCSTVYPLNLWGGYFEPLVAYFKGLRRTQTPTFQELRAKVAKAV